MEAPGFTFPVLFFIFFFSLIDLIGRVVKKQYQLKFKFYANVSQFIFLIFSFKYLLFRTTTHFSYEERFEKPIFLLGLFFFFSILSCLILIRHSYSRTEFENQSVEAGSLVSKEEKEERPITFKEKLFFVSAAYGWAIFQVGIGLYGIKTIAGFEMSLLTFLGGLLFFFIPFQGKKQEKDKQQVSRYERE